MCALLKCKSPKYCQNMCLELYVSSPHLDHASSLLQEVELFEACQHALVGHVHHLLMTGVSVNVTQFVSGQRYMNFDSRFSVLCQYCSPFMYRIMSHENMCHHNSHVTVL